MFEEIVDRRMRANDAGMVADAVWRAIPAHFPQVRLDAFVVMPNHIHTAMHCDEFAHTSRQIRGAGPKCARGTSSPDCPQS